VAVVVEIFRTLTLRPPAKVEVAVVLVANIAAKLGVVVPTTFPDESVERIIFGPTFES
jgi:hypothetical protein